MNNEERVAAIRVMAKRLGLYANTAKPAASAPWWKVVRTPDPKDAHRVYINGVIDDEHGELLQELHHISAEGVPIELHINSPGGFVWDAYAIYNALVQFGPRVTAYVDGVAASAASFIFQAADARIVGEVSEIYIHNAYGLALGDPDELRAFAEELDLLSDDIAGIYARRSGKGTVAQWRERMAAPGTTFNAARALAVGLADKLATGEPSATAAERLSMAVAAARVRHEQHLRARAHVQRRPVAAPARPAPAWPPREPLPAGARLSNEAARRQQPVAPADRAALAAAHRWHLTQEKARQARLHGRPEPWGAMLAPGV